MKVFGREIGKRTRRHTACLEPVLGTRLDFTVDFQSGCPNELEQLVLQEIDRLSAIFNRYSPKSELSRWEANSAGSEEWLPVSPELAELLQMSTDWRELTRGAFHPAVEAITRHWEAQDSVVAGAERAKALADELAGPLWEVDGEGLRARKITPHPANLNAIAKGFIIDRAATHLASVPGVSGVLINIGGDLRHIGERPVRALITDPHQPFDNAAPLDRILLKNGALATSGHYHRGFQLDGQHASHILDPRTGLPCDAIPSVSVVAQTAMEADVLSTALSVLPPSEGLQLVNQFPGIGCLIIDQTGCQFPNAVWELHRSVQG